jgi:hypothetical protein
MPSVEHAKREPMVGIQSLQSAFFSSTTIATGESIKSADAIPIQFPIRSFPQSVWNVMNNDVAWVGIVDALDAHSRNAVVG